ncbi:hypothetical protein XENTR_v10004390 [Xenopus tropicalis]|nr:hypothetical protein XENTR_v10004390 [Xenopus tropicalis]
MKQKHSMCNRGNGYPLSEEGTGRLPSIQASYQHSIAILSKCVCPTKCGQTVPCMFLCICSKHASALQNYPPFGFLYLTFIEHG